MIGPFPDRQSLRKRKRSPDSCKRPRTRAYNYAIDVTKGQLPPCQELLHLYGPIRTPGIRSFKQLANHIAAGSQRHRLHVGRTVYRKEVHPCFAFICSQASMNGWMWPSITPFTSLVSYSVRRSLTIVYGQNTYERIWLPQPFSLFAP